MRVDARRNREKIVESARNLFARGGLSVSVDEIATHAGVGVGTLYRHFPVKNALFEAVVLDHLQASIANARAHAALGEPGEAFFDCLATLVDEAVSRKDFLDTLSRSDVDLQSITAALSAQLREILEKLLKSAQRVGSARRDVEVTDVLIILNGVCLALGQSSTQTQQHRKVWEVMSDRLRSRKS